MAQTYSYTKIQATKLQPVSTFNPSTHYHSDMVRFPTYLIYMHMPEPGDVKNRGPGGLDLPTYIMNNTVTSKKLVQAPHTIYQMELIIYPRMRG